MSNPADLLCAIQFAAERHRNQRRKDVDASPYINHPIAVAHLLATEGGVSDISVLMAAILHDTIEDTGTTVEELRSLFGAEVAEIVSEVTDDKTLPKQRRKELQIELAPYKSEKAALIKIADAACNFRDLINAPPQHWSSARRSEYFDWAALVVAGLRCDNAPLLHAFKIAHDQGDRHLSSEHTQCADKPLRP
ncbi:HD domain-containing protein [Pandoraea sputorum]|uniref:Bifunctional (P)ppGpp synthase/hydrolase RelA n=1 Tax=Pandoraea sputorum TaxID=93222 RepID=A0A5E5AT78_9BURK|nr:HD domain-containing protein [Pandoraea sputorum]VVE76969.1 Bifunctional (p)ppGpp synthase/hydrolase RelA [Pandoraea sputorum]